MQAYGKYIELPLSVFDEIPEKLTVEQMARMSGEEIEQSMIDRLQFYQFHPLGAETWIEDHLYANLLDFRTGKERWMRLGELPYEEHPVTGRSYREMWENQKKFFIRPAVARDERGMLVHHTVVNCQPRGEGKSFQTVMLILWRFFCIPGQTIILGANSASQSRFALYDIIKKMILNSPQCLEILGRDNIKEKHVALTNSHGDVMSRIIAVSAFTGIYSNITGFGFSEIFDMKNPKFYYQLDSSRRNIPNAQGYIDSTVSTKDHILYTLYENSPLRHNEDDGIMYMYRFSSEGDWKDFWHPMMTEKQLNSFRSKFTQAEFARYFKNTWTLVDTTVFTRAMTMAQKYLGVNGVIGNQAELLQKCQQIALLEEQQEEDITLDNRSETQLIRDQLFPIPFSLVEDGHPKCITMDELANLTEIYDTNWAIGVGGDLADPLKDDATKGARTILSFIVKGLPGSRTNPSLHLEQKGVVKYIYFLIHLVHIEDNEPVEIQHQMELFLAEFGVINVFCSERWGAGELRKFCEEKDIEIELISPTYERQRTAFNNFYRLSHSGYFKIPRTVVQGSESSDIVTEEQHAFRHDALAKWYGSETKGVPTGVQDDAMFSIGWGLFGLRELTPDDFMPFDRNNIFMGMTMENKDLTGSYR